MFSAHARHTIREVWIGNFRNWIPTQCPSHTHSGSVPTPTEWLPCQLRGDKPPLSELGVYRGPFRFSAPTRHFQAQCPRPVVLRDHWDKCLLSELGVYREWIPVQCPRSVVLTDLWDELLLSELGAYRRWIPVQCRAPWYWQIFETKVTFQN